MNADGTDQRDPYDPSGLPYVVTWTSLNGNDHDLTYGPFNDFESAVSFAKSLGRTENHGGHVLQVVYPPTDL